MYSYICFLETIAHFVHASSFYFNQELLQNGLWYENYSYTIWHYYFIISWNYILLLYFFIRLFYSCLLAVRRASARQAAPPSLSPIDILFLGNYTPIYSICITCQWHGAGRTTWALWLLKVYISCTEEFHKMNFEMELSVRCLQFNIVLDFCSCFELFSCTASHLWFAIVLGT
jgi:hypothetical protein